MYNKSNSGSFKFDLFVIFKRNKLSFEVEDALDADGFIIPTEMTFKLDASPKIVK